MENLHQHLSKFVGVWHTEGIIPAGNEQPATRISGTDTYEWILENSFLLHRADVIIGKEKSLTYEIIGVDKSKSQYSMQYYNNKGEQGAMIASLDNNIWKFTGAQLRFSGGFTNEGKVFSGNWEVLKEHNDWVHLMNIKLTKKED